MKKSELEQLIENKVRSIIKENYETDQINSILKPETDYKYNIQLGNGSTGHKTKFMTITKEQLLQIQKILK